MAIATCSRCAANTMIPPIAKKTTSATAPDLESSNDRYGASHRYSATMALRTSAIVPARYPPSTDARSTAGKKVMNGAATNAGSSSR